MVAGSIEALKVEIWGVRFMVISTRSNMCLTMFDGDTTAGSSEWHHLVPVRFDVDACPVTLGVSTRSEPLVEKICGQEMK